MQFIFLLLLIVLQILDIRTTQEVLKLGGYEANPIMKWFMNKIGTNLALYVTKAVFIGFCTYMAFYAGINSLWALVPLTLFYVGIVNNNDRVIKKLEK